MRCAGQAVSQERRVPDLRNFVEDLAVFVEDLAGAKAFRI